MEPGKAKWICAKHGRMAPELLLEWLGITEPPVDPQALAEALGVIVAEDDRGGPHRLDHGDQFLRRGAKSI